MAALKCGMVAVGESSVQLSDQVIERQVLADTGMAASGDPWGDTGHRDWGNLPAASEAGPTYS